MEREVSGSAENSKNHYEKLQDSIRPKMTNVVSGFDIGIKVDLKDIARRALNAEYNPNRFNAVVMRIREPKTTALIFPSGRIIVTGAKSVDDSKLACRKIARIIQKLNYTQAQLKDWKVVNLVGLIELPFEINVTRLAIRKPFLGMWEPEIFPAFVGRILKPKMTFLAFSSGKIVVAGFKKQKDLDTALDLIFPVLVEFKITDD